uniref:NADH dehydrogenase subunit 6 n=1 Tax=Macrogyrodactylus karibae TaxID=696689 RepID=A0A2Z4GPJ9_9PLAT|nr:NADH dehydrogenase subunit 6 [Macrogyrodactylus karibae]
MTLFFLISLFIFVSTTYNVFVASGAYCLFLVSLTLISSSILLFLNLSFWYCLVMLLIYIGGVYVLLLFVSIYSYNTFSFSGVFSFLFMTLFFFTFFVFTYSNGWEYWSNLYNFELSLNESYELVSLQNWVSYMFILLCILISFCVFSFIFSDNSGYTR